MKSLKIVVIDDNEDILELLKYNLNQEKASVITFTKGNEAFNYINQKKPDAIICDWMLEDIDGLEICRRVKMNPELRNIPFIMLTARGDEIDVVTALELGAEDYIVKPIRIRELTTRLKKIIRRSKNNEKQNLNVSNTSLHESSIHYKDIAMDIDRHTVSIAEESLELTYSEFKLLQLLISRPGKVFSRSQIIEKLNGIDYIATERSVDVQVVGLRKKIGKYKGYLETVRGVGYRIKD